MNVIFHVVHGAKPGQVTLPLPVVIGRGRETDLTLPLSLISRQHCKLFSRQGEVWLEDLNSTNGTYLDGVRIAAATPVADGQSLTIGSVTLRLQLTATSHPTAQPPALTEQNEGDSNEVVLEQDPREGRNDSSISDALSDIAETLPPTVRGPGDPPPPANDHIPMARPIRPNPPPNDDD